MSQHDYNLINAPGLSFRNDLNLALLAIVSNNSGATEPATTFSLQFWADTTLSKLRLRNGANNAWIEIGDLTQTNLGFAALSGPTMVGALLAAIGLVSAPGISFAGDVDSGFYWISANTWGLVANGVEYMRISTAGITMKGTGATTLASGTTAQRPGTPVNGMIRYNTDLTNLDVYVNGAWKTLPGVSAYPFTTTDLADKVEAVIIPPSDFGGVNSTTQVYPQFPWSAPVKISNPATLPAGNGSACAMTLNSEFVTIGHSTTPFFSNYQRKGTELVKLANPVTLPASAVVDAAYSQSGEFLAVATATTPFIQIYQRATGTSIWVKLANPATLPAGAATGVAWSPNSEFLTVTHASSPFCTVYQRSGTTFTKLIGASSQFSSTLPTGQGNGAAWSSDGRFMMVAHTSSPYLSVYERTLGTTFTKISNPATLPASDGLGCAISNDGIYFALTVSSSPYCLVYSRSGTTLTKMVAGDTSQFCDSAELPTGQGNRVAFSLDGSHMTVAHNTSPYITDYILTSGEWEKQTNPSTLPAGNALGVCWQSEREFLLVANTTTPFLVLYQTASDMSADSVVIIKKIPRAGT